MGPTCKRRTTRSSNIRKSTTMDATTQKKKAAQKSSPKMAESPAAAAAAAALHHQPYSNISTPSKCFRSVAISSSTIDGDCDFVQTEKSSDYCSPCTTPRSEKFRIPEIQTCPPAPKKQRVVNYSTLTRRPISFFAPPDVELFFLVALRDIPAA